MKAKKTRRFEKTIYTTAEAIEILEISPKEFSRRKKQPDSKIVPTNVNGKLFVKHVLEEYERIHGKSRKEVLVSNYFG